MNEGERNEHTAHVATRGVSMKVFFIVLASALPWTAAFVHRGQSVLPQSPPLPNKYGRASRSPSFQISRKRPIRLNPTAYTSLTSAILAKPSQLNNAPSSNDPSAFFLVLTAMLSLLLYEIQNSSLPATIGILSLVYVTSALAYDNFIIGLGSPVFANAKSDKKEYTVLKFLSYPRFIFHAVRLPFLCATSAEIGKAAGVEWLQSDLVQTLVLIVAAVIALVSRLHFIQSPGIELADTSTSPPNALERQLLWFTYKEPDFLYNVGPSLLLAVWSIVVGIASYRLSHGGEAAEGAASSAGLCLIGSAVGVLAGNSQKAYVARFTGNLSEVTMLWCMYLSATCVLSTAAGPDQVAI